MLSLASVLGQRFGRVEDTIGAGTRAYTADTAAKQSAADNAWKTYNALLSEYQLTNPAKKYEAGSVGRTGYIFDPSTGEIKSTFLGADSGSGGTDIKGLIDLLFPDGLNGGGAQQPTEPKPNINMNNFPQGGNYRSPGGQWAYDWQSSDWVPVID
jgi:hypothetical protein